MAGKLLTAADFDAGVVLEVNELAPFELAQNLVGRHVPKAAKVGHGIDPSLGFVRIVVDDNVHQGRRVAVTVAARMMVRSAVETVAVLDSAFAEAVVSLSWGFFPLDEDVELVMPIWRDLADQHIKGALFVYDDAFRFLFVFNEHQYF